VLRTKHTAANGPSQRPCIELDNINKASKVDINNFINAKLNAFSVAPIAAKEAAEVDLLIDKYLKDSWRIARYLTTLQRLARLNKTEFQSFKRRALHYAVIDSNLY
jgi:hypothetical protein